jgi:hypothetical protein
MKDKTEVWWTRHKQTMPNMTKLQAIVTRDIELVAPADGVNAAPPDKNMELFVWWWDEMLPCATAPNTEFWTNEKRWYHHIHDGKVGDEPLLTPQDETFAFLCFENYYRQWEKDFQIKAKHPKKKLVKAKQKDFVPPTNPRIVARGYGRNGDRDRQIWSWLGDEIQKLQGRFSIVQWMDQCRQGTIQEIVETHQAWSQQTDYSCQRGAGL